MDNIKPALTVGQFIKDNELVNLTNTHDLYNEIGCVMNSNDYDIRLLHHNVQSLNNKLLDITIMLTTDNLNVDILCFTEHWLSEVQINVLNIDYFRLVSTFSRSHSTSGRSHIFTRNIIEMKEVNYLRELGLEKVFEISAVELSDIDAILTCIYRS
jgi:hypothetical protein